MHIRVERSIFAVLRWTFFATVAAAGFIYVLAQLGPATAIAG